MLMVVTLFFPAIPIQNLYGRKQKTRYTKENELKKLSGQNLVYKKHTNPYNYTQLAKTIYASALEHLFFHINIHTVKIIDTMWILCVPLTIKITKKKRK